MKFCKNLQRVVDISDPEWAPYWTNYKMLKKIIKELPSLVPNEDDSKKPVRSLSREGSRPGSPSSVDTTQSSTFLSAAPRNQQEESITESTAAAPLTTSHLEETVDGSMNETVKINVIGKSPGEVAFFKLLHTELQKATRFFENAQEEFRIREERVHEGMAIMKQPKSMMVNDKWSLLAKSLFRLYKDLLLLETFAIMTYCSFSKILKKHDKVTGYNTRCAFMANVVNKANFTSYPLVLKMISRCEELYENASEHLMHEGKVGLYEDERLFINMIHRLNAQCLDTAEGEGAERMNARRPGSSFKLDSLTGNTSPQSRAHSTLRSLVEENDKKALEAQVMKGITVEVKDSGVSSTKGEDQKESASIEPIANVIEQVPKRQRTE